MPLKDSYQLLTHRFLNVRKIAKCLIDLEISKYFDLDLVDFNEPLAYLYFRKSDTTLRDFILFTDTGVIHYYHWDPLTGHDHILQKVSFEECLRIIKKIIDYFLSGYYF